MCLEKIVFLKSKDTEVCGEKIGGENMKWGEKGKITAYCKLTNVLPFSFMSCELISTLHFTFLFWVLDCSGYHKQQCWHLGVAPCSVLGKLLLELQGYHVVLGRGQIKTDLSSISVGLPVPLVCVGLVIVKFWLEIGMCLLFNELNCHLVMTEL